MSEHDQLIRRPGGLLLYRTNKEREADWREDDTYKLLFAIDGAIRYQTKAADITLFEQQFLILNPHVPHKQMGYDQQKFLLQLSPALVNEVADTLRQRHTFDIQFAFQLQKHPQLTQWVQFTRDYLLLHKGTADESVGLFLDHALVQLCLLLVKYGIGSHTKDISTAYVQSLSPVLFPVMEAIKESFTEPWTLDQMAAVAGVSKYQFAHVFKETVGVSPYSWLQLYRLVRSQELLLHSQQSILEIALACGFSSINVYTQLFRRIYGTSPSSFRNRYR